MTSLLQQKKAEKFINTFFKGMDDPVLEQIMRCQYLGDEEKKLDDLLERQRKEMEEYASHFELDDVTKVVMTDEEIEEILREQSSPNPSILDASKSEK
jgi:23S rRNA maturation mini-RNase III